MFCGTSHKKGKECQQGMSLNVPPDPQPIRAQSSIPPLLLGSLVLQSAVPAGERINALLLLSLVRCQFQDEQVREVPHSLHKSFKPIQESTPETNEAAWVNSTWLRMVARVPPPTALSQYTAAAVQLRGAL